MSDLIDRATGEVGNRIYLNVVEAHASIETTRRLARTKLTRGCSDAERVAAEDVIARAERSLAETIRPLETTIARAAGQPVEQMFRLEVIGGYAVTYLTERDPLAKFVWWAWDAERDAPREVPGTLQA